MDTPQWFYARDGARHGPVPQDELQRLAAAGALRPHDLVWREGMAQWLPAQQATDFFGPAAELPPPLPPQPPHAAPGAFAPPNLHAPYPPQKPLGEDPGVRMLLPVGRSGWAIAAGYLGLFSVLGCFAPVSVVVSIIAMRDIRAHPERHGMGRAVFGLVMGILGCIILVAMIGGMLANRGR